MNIRTTVPMKCASGTLLYDHDDIDISETLDSFQRLALTLEDARGINSHTTTINQAEAQQIVDHLTRVFALQQSVWVLAKHGTENAGHGDSMPVIKLGQLGDYGSNGPCPAFATEDAANRYIKDGKAPRFVAPLQLSIAL